MHAPVPELLRQMAIAYQQALLNIKSQHGDPVRVVRHHFTTTLYYQGPDGQEDLIIEIEPDLEAQQVRVLAVLFNGYEDGHQLYLRTESTVISKSI